MPKPKRLLISMPGYIGQERRSGINRRRVLARRKAQCKPAGESFEREYGKILGGIEDWLPPRFKVPDERRGKERRGGTDRRKSKQ